MIKPGVDYISNFQNFINSDHFKTDLDRIMREIKGLETNVLISWDITTEKFVLDYCYGETMASIIVNSDFSNVFYVYEINNTNDIESSSLIGSFKENEISKYKDNDQYIITNKVDKYEIIKDKFQEEILFINKLILKNDFSNLSNSKMIQAVKVLPPNISKEVTKFVLVNSNFFDFNCSPEIVKYYSGDDYSLLLYGNDEVLNMKFKTNINFIRFKAENLTLEDMKDIVNNDGVLNTDLMFYFSKYNESTVEYRYTEINIFNYLKYCSDEDFNLFLDKTNYLFDNNLMTNNNIYYLLNYYSFLNRLMKNIPNEKFTEKLIKKMFELGIEDWCGINGFIINNYSIKIDDPKVDLSRYKSAKEIYLNNIYELPTNVNGDNKVFLLNNELHNDLLLTKDHLQHTIKYFPENKKQLKMINELLELETYNDQIIDPDLIIKKD